MARFDGVFPAAELKPAPCGLLSVATVERHAASDDRWVSGFDVQVTSTPTVRILAAETVQFDDGVIFENDPKVPTHYRNIPFTIEIEVKTTGFNVIHDDPITAAKGMLDAVTQKALERELWEGLSATADDNDNIFLRNIPADHILTSGAVHPKRGLAILEGAISFSPTGGAGTLHMTRDTASSILGGGLSFEPDPEDPTSGALFTSLGTPVVAGSGYTGNGPKNSAGTDATATNKWMYLTGPVTVHIGAPEVVNDSIRQGFNADTNDSFVKALVSGSVSFDPAIFFTAQVTLPDVP